MDNLNTNPTGAENDIIAGILQGYRFSLCDSPEAVERALDVRRRVYVEGVGYDVPVPDAYDHRSWLLLAEDEATGQAVGSMRLTPRFAGPFELEEYFTLPASLRSPRDVEVNRFAILPEYRKGKTFLPSVSLGLFKLTMRFLQSINARHLVIASKPERIWTYEWMAFRQTGHVARYGSLDSIEHALLEYDLRHAAELFAGHPFESFFMGLDYREVVLPSRLPELGIGVAAPLRQSA